MEISDLEKRLEEARAVLEEMAAGNLDVAIEVEHFGVDATRFNLIMETLLARIRETRSTWVISDVTGVAAIDEYVADWRACRHRRAL